MFFKLQSNDSNKPVVGVLTETYVIVPWLRQGCVKRFWVWITVWNVNEPNSSENREITKRKRFNFSHRFHFCPSFMIWTRTNFALVPASAIIRETTSSLCSNSYFIQPFTGAPSKNPQQLANSCNPNKCLNNAQCIEGKSTFFCVCPPNTSGRLCEKKTTPTTGTTIVVNWFMVWIKSYGLFEWKKVLTTPFTSYNGFNYLNVGE